MVKILWFKVESKKLLQKMKNVDYPLFYMRSIFFKDLYHIKYIHLPDGKIIILIIYSYISYRFIIYKIYVFFKISKS